MTAEISSSSLLILMYGDSTAVKNTGAQVKLKIYGK